MKTKKLGSTGMEITRLGLGTWAIGGGGWAFGWGPQEDQESISTIEAALELGINWIDTAPIYGLGHSEEVVGKAVAGFRGERPLIFTKLGMQWTSTGEVSQEISPKTAEAEVEASLKRLGVDVIDLLQIHWPIPDDRLEATWEQLLTIRDAGKVRFLGVCNCDQGQLERLAKIELPASNQPPFNLLQQQILKATAPWCADHDLGLIPYSPLMSGLLSGKFTRARAQSLADDDWRRHLPIVQGAELDKLLALTDRLSGLAQERGTTMANLAIAWTLRFDAITGPIVGARSPEQIRETVKAADVAIDDELARAIDDALDTYGTRTLTLY